MEEKNFSALLGINGYKAVAVVSLAFVSVYSVKKFVDKFYNSSVVINSDGNIAGGK